MVKNLPAVQETGVQSLVQKDSPGEGNGNPLQDSCLENSMDRGAWRATVHGVTKRNSDFPGNPVVKTSPSNTVSVGSVTGWGAKSLPAS